MKIFLPIFLFAILLILGLITGGLGCFLYTCLATFPILICVSSTFALISYWQFKKYLPSFACYVLYAFYIVIPLFIAWAWMIPLSNLANYYYDIYLKPKKQINTYAYTTDINGKQIYDCNNCRYRLTVPEGWVFNIIEDKQDYSEYVVITPSDSQYSGIPFHIRYRNKNDLDELHPDQWVPIDITVGGVKGKLYKQFALETDAGTYVVIPHNNGWFVMYALYLIPAERAPLLDRQVKTLLNNLTFY